MRLFFALVATFLLSSCAFFQREPPLPRHALIEASGSEEKFLRLTQEADIIYFPTERAGFGSRSDAVWKVLEALRRDPGSFALAWDWTDNERDRRNYLTEAGKLGAVLLPLNEAGENKDQAAADKISTYFLGHRNQKVFVLLGRERLALGQGVPYLVAQQTKARQLILNPQRSDARRPLFARN